MFLTIYAAFTSVMFGEAMVEAHIPPVFKSDGPLVEMENVTNADNSSTSHLHPKYCFITVLCLWDMLAGTTTGQQTTEAITTFAEGVWGVMTVLWGVVKLIVSLATFDIPTDPPPPTWVRLLVSTPVIVSIVWALAGLVRGK